MKLAIIGAGGTIGQRIVQEALNRGHDVTALVRDVAKYTAQHPQVNAVKADALDAQSVAEAVKGHDAVISAFGPGFQGGDLQAVGRVAESLIEALPRAGVERLVVVGGAGGLEVAPGLLLIDAPQFPAEWKGIAQAHIDALNVYREASLDWSFLSPPALITPGERTGTYRLGGTQLLTDAEGQSQISTEDYAVALLDEVESPQHARQQFTVAY